MRSKQKLGMYLVARVRVPIGQTGRGFSSRDTARRHEHRSHVPATCRHMWATGRVHLFNERKPKLTLSNLRSVCPRSNRTPVWFMYVTAVGSNLWLRATVISAGAFVERWAGSWVISAPKGESTIVSSNQLHIPKSILLMNPWWRAVVWSWMASRRCPVPLPHCPREGEVQSNNAAGHRSPVASVESAPSTACGILYSRVGIESCRLSLSPSWLLDYNPWARYSWGWASAFLD